jgi:hypothetical protein
MKGRLSKLDAAKRQIQTAIDLYFLHGDMVSVMTLAGAAEEICGNLLARHGKQNILAIMSAEAEKQGFQFTNKELYNRASSMRNALKHAKDPSEDVFIFDDEAAVFMLIRAVINYQLLGQPLSEEMEKFIVWVRTHGLLIKNST